MAQGSGWNAPLRPGPIQTPSQPSPPVQGIQGPPGPAGKDGEQGPAGPPGSKGDPATVDYDQLVSEVMKRMPAIVIQITDKDGKTVEELPFQFDARSNAMVAKLPPIPVTTYDANNNRIGTDTYPLGWAIRIKPIPIKSEK